MNQPAYSLKALTLYFLKLGSIGFGGPVALVGYMHRDLVESRKWISDEDYKEGLALAQLAPGPLAAQLAIYLGYVHYRIWGATLAGFAFVLPSFLMVLALGYSYVRFGGLSWMQAVFYGIGAAVIGIITVSSYKLITKTIKSDYVLWGIFVVLMVTTFVYETEFISLIIASGIIYWLVKRPPANNARANVALLAPVLLQIPGIAANSKLAQIWWFFFKAGAFVFGSGLAIVPFLYGGVVKEYEWLNDQQFLDAVAVAMITPGPVVITVAFIGYLVEGFDGAAVAALATFLPCYLLTIIPAPYFKKYGKRPGLKAFVDGVTAAAIGAIAGAVLVLGKRQLTDTTSVVIAIVVIFIMMRFKKISEPYIIVAAALAGLLISSIRAQAQTDNSLSGSWRGEFAIRDGLKAPFNFDITDDSTVYLINGPERFEAGKVRAEGDSLFIALDQFDNELALAKRKHTLTGVLRRQDKTAIIAPLTATFGAKSRFESTSKPSRDISGTYEVEFSFESGNIEKAIAILKQDGQKLSGTFLKPSGDTRFLEGIVDGEQFFLSSFIGSSPGYYEGTVSQNGTIRGFQAGTRVMHTFTGKINASAGIQDPYSVTRVQDGVNKISFTLPDIDGKPVSLTDEKYRNKVVIVAITGTWCPNCIDEAAFLSPWYNKNRERGVEIVTVHFERQADTAFTRKVMTRFRKRFNIEYDQVFGGISQKDSVTKAIAGLEAFRSFPTTIFVDKKGNVSKIHAGYTGPATGRFYDEFVKEFNDEVDRLLKQ